MTECDQPEPGVGQPGPDPDVVETVTAHDGTAQLVERPVAEALPVFNPREGVDALWPGEAVIYFQRLSALRTKSRLSQVIGTPAYKSMTIRTWNTTTKLLALLSES